MGYPCFGDELNDKREGIIKTYSRHIGVRELTGKNDGDEVELYLKSAGLSKGFAWCAAFVYYCHIENNITGPKNSPAWSPSWFPLEKVIPNEDGLRGDVFGLYYSEMKRIGHVGFIDENWDNRSNFILTVEGNTNGDGGREGDGVYRKRRSKKQIHKISKWIS